MADPSSLAVSAARQSAVADAIDQARQLAIAARVSLGEIVAMCEPVGAGAAGSSMARQARFLSTTAPELDPGESTISVVVEVVHRIA